MERECADFPDYDAYELNRVAFFSEQIQPVLESLHKDCKGRHAFLNDCLRRHNKAYRSNATVLRLMNVITAIMTIVQQAMNASNWNEAYNTDQTPTLFVLSLVCGVFSIMLSALVHHLSQKQSSMQTRFEQLAVSRNAFMGLLKSVEEQYTSTAREASKMMMVKFVDSTFVALQKEILDTETVMCTCDNADVVTWNDLSKNTSYSACANKIVQMDRRLTKQVKKSQVKSHKSRVLLTSKVAASFYKGQETNTAIASPNATSRLESDQSALASLDP